MAQHTPAQQLYDLLVSRNFDPELLDSSGRPSQDPSDTEIFSFDFQTESGNDYGTVVVMLGDNNDMEIYFGDNIGRGMEVDDKKEWFDFLYQLRMFAKRNLMTFGLKNLNRLRYSMQGQAAIKEGLFESWNGKKDVSWNAGATESRLMIKHKRVLGEDEARFRCVESLFIETAEGERYKLPFRNLTGGKAMLEHVRNGGRPYDARGQHISEMVTELNVLSRFRRANHGRIFEGDTAALVEQTNAYYETARCTLKSLSTKSGYNTYFETWDPEQVTEEEMVIEGLKHLFITQTLDQRIEEALPILARIQQQGTEMKEANIFEAWARQLVEGTWATPDTPEKRATLAQLMSAEFPVGPDATNATEQLYDIMGDDVLFDRLETLSTQDADADARQIIYDRMQELADHPDVRAAMSEFTMDQQTPTAEPAEPMGETVKDPADQTEDPEGTQQPDYDEYADSLKNILQRAGVDDTVKAAPPYEASVEEDSQPGVVADFDEGKCNMTEAGEMCPQHGMMECGMYEEELDELNRRDFLKGAGAALGGAALAGLAGGAQAGKMPSADSQFQSGGDLPQITKTSTGHEMMIGDKTVSIVWGKYALKRKPVKVPAMYKGKQINILVDPQPSDYPGSPANYYIGVPEDGQRLAEEPDNSPLAGQYGHSGKMKPVEKDVSFLDRLKELSGMMRK